MRNYWIYRFWKPSRGLGTRFCVYKALGFLVSLSLTIFLILARRLEHLYSKQTVLKGKFISGSKISEPKCALPVLPLDNPEIMKYIEDFKKIECLDGKDGKDWVVNNGSHAVVTEEAKTKYGEIRCRFSEIERVNDFDIRLSSPHSGLSYEFANTDFIQAECSAKGNKNWKSFLAAPRSNIELPPLEVEVSNAQFNVIVWGHDSISRNMFMRKLPLSYSFLTEKLGGIVLKGYNIVGDGTPQALIPMLTGKTELELPETRKRMGIFAKHVNVYPFIWNDYREKGYLTGYLEDCPPLGTFTYRLKGFKKSPTDFYIRPYFIAASQHYEEFPKFCIGSIPRHKIMMNYVRDIMEFKKNIPKFLFSFFSELSHDHINEIQGADEDLREFLNHMESSAILNNTVLVIFSDHGSRFSYIRDSQQGKQEERMPMIMFVFPPRFQKLHRQAFENFQKNAHFLTTPFDIHATLRDLLTISSKPEEFFLTPHEKGDRSLSLFRPIFPDRTCKEAFIEPHWCACLQWQVLNTSLTSVQKAAQEFVEYLNAYMAKQTTLCTHLSLGQVIWAANLFPSEEVLHFKRSADLDGFLPDLSDKTEISKSTLQLKVETLPGSGRFEVSLQHDLVEDSFHFNIEDISRINKYGIQASCLEQSMEHLRKFCFCSEQRAVKT